MKPENQRSSKRIKSGQSQISLNTKPYPLPAFWVKTGSRLRTGEDNNGVSHFWSIWCLGEPPAATPAEISRRCPKQVGGPTNAYTSREFTAFYAKMLNDDAELAVDVSCL